MKPKVFFVIGPAGSGKSMVGKRIAKRYDAAYVDKDTVATGFTELLLELNGSDKDDRDNNAFYQSTILPVEYETILRICGDNLALGRSVVLDAPFGRFFEDRNYLIAAYVAALGGQLRLAVDLPNGQTVALDRPIEHTTPRAFGQAV